MPKRAPKTDDSPPLAPFWYLTFGDMITLLLSFFVMLATFSTYSKESLDKFAGMCSGISATSIFGARDVTRDSLLPPRPRVVDFTERGSEQLADDSTTPTRNPKQHVWVSDVQAYSAGKVVAIPSAKLFDAEGMLSQEGKGYLKMLADFMRLLPHQAIISENGPLGDVYDDATRLTRAQQVVEYLVTQENLPAEMFALSVGQAASGGLSTARRTVRITLTYGSTFK